MQFQSIADIGFPKLATNSHPCPLLGSFHFTGKQSALALVENTVLTPRAECVSAISHLANSKSKLPKVSQNAFL
jgi:hypothetical protein